MSGSRCVTVTAPVTPKLLLNRHRSVAADLLDEQIAITAFNFPTLEQRRWIWDCCVQGDQTDVLSSRRFAWHLIWLSGRKVQFGPDYLQGGLRKPKPKAKAKNSQEEMVYSKREEELKKRSRKLKNFEEGSISTQETLQNTEEKIEEIKEN
ncbi:hypothetical protein C8J56DRAFT_879798 [Mycena floridula]|nr:hypothetical protein C8J56DRAFT_879798 [Mycena floridula]